MCWLVVLLVLSHKTAFHDNRLLAAAAPDRAQSDSNISTDTIDGQSVTTISESRDSNIQGEISKPQYSGAILWTDLQCKHQCAGRNVNTTPSSLDPS